MTGRVQAFVVSSEAEIQNVLDRLEQAFEGRRLVPRKERRRYLDTFDWRIHRSGGWLSETPGRKARELLWAANGHAPRSAMADRAPDFAEDLPAGPLRQALEDIVAPRRLMSVADVQRKTQTLELLDVEGKIVCRVKAITNEAAARPAPTTTSRILLEGVRGYDEELQVVDRFIRYQLQLTTTEAREIEEILVSLEVDAGRDPSALDISLTEEMTANEAVRRILATLRRVLVVNRRGLIDALDTEFLHDFRVAVRRTRSVLSQVKHVLPSVAVQHYLQEFRWLGDITGTARDLDVFLLNMPAYEQQLPAGDATALHELTTFLVEDRKREQAKLVKELRGTRFEKLLVNWKTLLEEPLSGQQGTPPPLAELPAKEVASRFTWKRYKKVRKIGRAIDHDTPSAELHALRIQSKKLRYLFEVFRSLYPEKPMAQGIKALKRLQNTLGDFNDAQVHAGMLRQFAERVALDENGKPETIVAIGLLVSGLMTNRETERERFFGRFESFATPANHERFRELFGKPKGEQK